MPKVFDFRDGGFTYHDTNEWKGRYRREAKKRRLIEAVTTLLCSAFLLLSGLSISVLILLWTV